MRNRFDLYRNVHKGIRVMLLDLIQKSGRTDFTDITKVAKLRGEAREIFELLESHAHHEDRHVMPLIRAVAPQLAAEFAEEHEDQEARLPGLLAALETIDTSAPDAEARGHAFVVHLGRVAGELLTHMSDEELELNPVLWAAYSDGELHDAEQRLVAGIPPEKMARYLRWMLPAMNPSERAAFLGMLPQPVFDFVRTLAKQVLTPADDAKLEQALVGAVA